MTKKQDKAEDEVIVQAPTSDVTVPSKFEEGVVAHEEALKAAKAQGFKAFVNANGALVTNY